MAPVSTSSNTPSQGEWSAYWKVWIKEGLFNQQQAHMQGLLREGLSRHWGGPEISRSLWADGQMGS